MRIHRLRSLAVIALAAAVGGPALTQLRPIDVGSRKQLFLDRRFIGSSKNVELRLNEPDCPPENLLPQDRPWERGRVGGWASVIQDGDLYRMYYNSFEASYETRYLCLALSADGVHWQKPNLGLVEYHGSRENNIVGIGIFGRVFIDPFDAPGRRYKLLSMAAQPDPRWAPSRGAEQRQVYLFHSPDGLSWEREASPVLPFWIGTPTAVIWDDALRTWAVYPRAYLPPHGIRVFTRAAVERMDLAKPYATAPASQAKEKFWPEVLRQLPVVLKPDERDPPGMQVYTMNAHKLPEAQDAWVAFCSMWYSRQPDWRSGLADQGNSDSLEVQFAYSRDGVAWQRPWRRAVIRRGFKGSATENQIYTAGMVRRGDRLFVYYNGLPSRHLTGNYRTEDWMAVTGRAIYRLDGFVSADAAYEGGEITTPPLVFEGSALEVNAYTGGGGFVKVEILGEDGVPVPGRSLAEADAINGNSVRHTASWRGVSDVSALQGRPVRLHLAMRDASLYAFQFRPGGTAAGGESRKAN